MENVEQNTEVAPVRLRSPDRLQVVMTIESPDDLIPEDHQARVLWKVVESLDLSAFSKPIKAREGVRGRDATDPKLLVGIWLLGVSRGVGSARELARLCVESRPYQWMCGGVTLNHHTLSDFRVDHGKALDEMFSQILAMLLEKDVIKVSRISQDGMRVRACAGASSYRRCERLEQLLEETRRHVEELNTLLADPGKSAGMSAKQKAARKRAAREKQQRVQQAINELPQLKKKQEKRAKKVSKKDREKKVKAVRVSTTDAAARVMKMPNGGYNPGMNVQYATDTHSRAILGVSVTGDGNDHHLSEPMRKQVEQRTGRKVDEHLMDGGFLVLDDIEKAAAQGVTVYVPPKPPGKKQAIGSEFQPKSTDSEIIKEWRTRMNSPEGKEIYKLRAATSETVNADTRTHRGLDRMPVRGVSKCTCVALWSAIAYNVMHFAFALTA
jgi:transposase